MAEDVIEIVVTAKRIFGIDPAVAFGSFFWNGWQNMSLSQRDSEWLFGPYTQVISDYTAENHLKKMVIVHSISQFAERMDNLKANLSLLAPSTPVSIGGGLTITASDLLAKVNSMHLTVVDKQYLPGYGGANYGNEVEIKWSTLAGYMARGDAGFNYLVLHEIAHNTTTGLASRSWNINQFRDTKGSNDKYDANNEYFKRQEGQANSITREIAESVGLVITVPSEPTFPPFGFVPLGL